MTLREGMILSFEGGSSRSHYVESSLWKKLWTRRKTDYSMNESVHYKTTSQETQAEHPPTHKAGCEAEK